MVHVLERLKEIDRLGIIDGSRNGHAKHAKGNGTGAF